MNSTQESIEIAGIKDGIVILRNGSYRLVLQVAATNFALKSEQEQTSIVFQYQSFLNSLHFPVEFVVRSRRLDLTPYLKKMNELSEKQTSNELLSMQIKDYVDFVSQLINFANIMKKTFYAVISYDPISVKKVSIFDSLFGAKGQVVDHIKISDSEYKLHTDKLKERASIVANGLGSMGLHCFQLSTEQVIELFYQIYNPEVSSKERLSDADKLAAPIIIETNGQQSEEEKTETEKDQMIDNQGVVAAKKEADMQERLAEDDKKSEKEIRHAPKQTTTPTMAQTQPTVPATPVTATQQTTAPISQQGQN